MKKLMTIFALISIIILTIPINSYSFLLGSERSAILAKTDPFLAYYLSNYPDSTNSNLSSPYGSPYGIPPYGIPPYGISPYGIPNNMPNGPILNRAQLYGGNQPYNYNYGWNQPYGYGYYDGFNTYQANTYDSDDADDSDWRQNLPYNYGRPGTFSWWDYPPYSNPSYYIFGIEEPHLW